MNKKILFPILLLFATAFCFAQNETPKTINDNESEIEQKELNATDALEPMPTEDRVEESSDTLAPAPVEENEIQDFQLTLIPPIGTNGTKASKITNRISLNVFAGVNGGLDGLEAGGFANVITGNANGLQGAGFVNVVRGNFDGAQGSGFTNFVRGNFEGIQANGFANVNLKRTKGVQASGFINTSFSGIDGVQAAGFMNVAGGNSDGMQVSGFLNFAKNMDGIQLGFINVADTLDGLAIGFLSYARNGYHTLEASTNETFQANLAFKTGGSRYFYNIFATGVLLNDNSTENDFHWAFGYGIGSKFMLSKKLGINADAISYAIIPQTVNANQDFEEQDFGAVGKLNLGLSYKVAKHFTIFGGPTLNVLVNQNDSFFENINPQEIFTASGDDINVIVYPGFNVGIRI